MTFAKFAMTGLGLICSTVSYSQNSSTAIAANNQVPAGFHEFEVFGEKTFYLSHYPMFGSIHSYQVLIEVTLKGAGSDIKQDFLALKKRTPSASCGLSPENADGSDKYWVLPEMMKQGKSFRANLHCQNGKSPPVFVGRNVTAEIVKVIHFRLFQPDDKKPQALTYLLFGKNSETFMAHYIASHPDFDQVVSVSIDPKDKQLSDGSGPALEVTIPGREDKQSARLAEGSKAVVGRINGNGGEINIRVGSLIHYEPRLEIQR